MELHWADSVSVCPGIFTVPTATTATVPISIYCFTISLVVLNTGGRGGSREWLTGHVTQRLKAKRQHSSAQTHIVQTCGRRDAYTQRIKWWKDETIIALATRDVSHTQMTFLVASSAAGSVDRTADYWLAQSGRLAVSHRPHTRNRSNVIWQLEMWANAQRDGRPAEYRWRPLFNAAKFGWRPLLECRAVTLPRGETRWDLQGCPKLTKRSQPLVGQSSPYYQDMWRRYCCLTSFFSDCWYVP